MTDGSSFQDLGGGTFRVSGARVSPTTGRYVTSKSDGPRRPDGDDAEVEQFADGGPNDPMTDPANARVVAALRGLRPYFAPPAPEDKVIALLRAEGLWKPEYDA